MTIGTSILVIAVGAILKWAVTAHVSWINLQTAGTVLFVLGIVGLIVSLSYAFFWASRHPSDDPRAMRPPPDDRY
jgi:hypothetical protein